MYKLLRSGFSKRTDRIIHEDGLEEPVAPIQVASTAPPIRTPAAYTPKQLANGIIRTRGALEVQRKLVNVLLADIKGSMELERQLDPETWQEVFDAFFEVFAHDIKRRHGTDLPTSIGRNSGDAWIPPNEQMDAGVTDSPDFLARQWAKKSIDSAMTYVEAIRLSRTSETAPQSIPVSN